MRKVLSLVLVLALVLGSFAFTFAATPSDVVGEDSEDAVNVLMELGVVAGYPDGSFKPAGIVTRGEMAKIIICALGLDDYASGSSSFSDMAGHWADKYVAYAVSLGIINGYPDGTFKADNTVSYDEAAKMLVASLGYTEESLVGSWPVNWVTKAKVLGILDGIKAGSAGANRGDIAIMTYQTLDQEIGKVNKDGDFVTALTSVGTSDNMLTRLDASLFAPAVAYVTADNGIAGASFVVT
ncbi:MAG TPA: S-layer homology domain-containing protein, partial [Bacillota bacterium]|nr:S-layer homology domain-containing protein [Bacillota bacterium]